MRLLAQLLFQKFTSTEAAQDGGIQHYIETDSGFYIASPMTIDSFIIGFASGDEVKQRLCFEVNRFSCASLESLKSSHHLPDINRLSWSAIELYYAAYYAANGWMRCFGYGSTNLDKRHTSRLNKLAQNTGMQSVEPHKGTYKYKVDFPNQRIAFDRADGDGVHGCFWAAFLDFINDVKNKTNTLIADPQEIAEIDKNLIHLKNILTQSNHPNGNWLSFIRNSINYRFEYGFWHPNFGLNTRHRSIISDLPNQSKEDPKKIFSNTQDQIEQFVEACLFIITTLSQIIGFATEINRKKKYYLNRYPMKLQIDLGLH